jgi:bifunctional non-homologous end joining protein LigD
MVVSDMKKQVRTNKVFVDWSQNDEHKTTIAVYSLRARERPTVSTPISWEEAERCLKKKDANLLVFEAKQTVARVEKLGDLFAPVLELKQKLPDLKKMAASGAGQVQVDEAISIAAQAEDEPEKPLRRVAKKAAKPRAARKTSRKV